MAAVFGVSSRPVGPDLDRDLSRIYALAATSPAAINTVDLPWRLASPSFRRSERTRLWESDQGELAGWAVLQYAWRSLDYVIRPAVRSGDLEDAVFAWARPLLVAEAAARGEPFAFYTSARAGDNARVAAAERAGFVPQPWGYRRLARSLDDAIPAADPPAGVSIRPLAGASEVPAYVAMHRAAFQSTNMEDGWRAATLQFPYYTPELDLVAVSPDDALVGFCICWLTPPVGNGPEPRTAQIEPLGVLPGHQNRGVGTALLSEALQRAKALGARSILVDAESYNEASQRTYAAAGFQTAYETRFFRQIFSQ